MLHGGPSRSLYQNLFPPGKIVDSLSVSVFPAYKNRDFLHQKYVVEGLSIAQIAEQIGSSKSAIQKSLVRFGIPIRVPHQNHQTIRKKQPRQVSRADLVAAESINALKGKGLSLREIADVLTKMKVPTPAGGKKWHPEMVRRATKDIRKPAI